MAGQRPTPSGAGNTVGIPSEIIMYTGVINGLTQIPIFTASQRLVVERAIIRFNVAEGSARTGNLARVANGVAMTTNTDLTVTNGINLNAAANTNQTMVLAGAATGGIPTENIVEDGETVILELNGAAAAAAGRIVNITIEVTNKII
jgi:hypothetical protein